jgi:hypothetical protein
LGRERVLRRRVLRPDRPALLPVLRNGGDTVKRAFQYATDAVIETAPLFLIVGILMIFAGAFALTFGGK